MRCTWINGWSIPADQIYQEIITLYPEYDHTIIYPGEYWFEKIPKDTEFLIGYSLGAFLMLRYPDRLPSVSNKLLLAPFIDFKKESNRGGRMMSRQLTLLMRMLKRNSIHAINNFYELSSLPFHCGDQLPYAERDLLWGINQLLEEHVSLPVSNLAKAYIGEEDPLVDGRVLQAYFPDIHLVSQAKHGLLELLPAIADNFKLSNST